MWWMLPRQPASNGKIRELIFGPSSSRLHSSGPGYSSASYLLYCIALHPIAYPLPKSVTSTVQF